MKIIEQHNFPFFGRKQYLKYLKYISIYKFEFWLNFFFDFWRKKLEILIGNFFLEFFSGIFF
jgi:hypothetical protein